MSANVAAGAGPAADAQARIWAEVGAQQRDEGRNVATGVPVEVLPGIWELRESLGPVFDTPNCWVSLWILVDPAGKEPPAIVDTGVPRSTQCVIMPALKQLGIQPRQLAVAVNTHNHHDHAGSNIQLREATGCEIWIHADDAPGLERGSNFGEDKIHPHSADRLLTTGEQVRLAGRDYEVVHIPGHSPGSMGLYDRAGKLFFSGDALQAQGTETQGIAGAADREAYRRALDTMDRLAADPQGGIEHLLAAHPYLPFPDSHVHPAAEVKRYLAECRRFVDEIDAEILTAVRAGGASSTAQLAERITRQRGFAKTPVLATPLLGGLLGQLERAGSVRRVSGEGADAVWSAT